MKGYTTIQAAVLSAWASHYVWQNVVSIFSLTGSSMSPTLQEDDVVICDRRKWKPVEKGDIVVAKDVRDLNTFVCKRIVAEHGDLVLAKEGLLTIPQGHVWLQGDNTSDSYDSRYYGPLPSNMIQGRIVMRIWPLRSVKLFRREKT